MLHPKTPLYPKTSPFHSANTSFQVLITDLWRAKARHKTNQKTFGCLGKSQSLVRVLLWGWGSCSPTLGALWGIKGNLQRTGMLGGM